MLLCHRVVSDPYLDALLAEHLILHSNYRILIKRRRGIIADDALIRAKVRPLQAERNQLLISLGGNTIVRGSDGNHELVEGEARTELRNRGFGLRQEGEQVFLMVDWAPGSLGTAQLDPGDTLRLPPRVLRRFQEIAARLCAGEREPHRAAPLVHEMLERLRAEGLPFDPHAPADLREEVPAWVRALAEALDDSMSSLYDNPRLVDFETRLGWSPRQLRRLMEAFHARYSMQTTGAWRELMRWWRIPVGAAWMSAPGATTEYVAKQLGYARPSVFSEALANAGLPAPGDIRSRLLALS